MALYQQTNFPLVNTKKNAHSLHLTSPYVFTLTIVKQQLNAQFKLSLSSSTAHGQRPRSLHLALEHGFARSDGKNTDIDIDKS